LKYHNEHYVSIRIAKKQNKKSARCKAIIVTRKLHREEKQGWTNNCRAQELEVQ